MLDGGRGDVGQLHLGQACEAAERHLVGFAPVGRPQPRRFSQDALEGGLAPRVAGLAGVRDQVVVTGDAPVTGLEGVRYQPLAVGPLGHFPCKRHP